MALTAAEAATYLGVSRRTLYAYVSRGLVVSEPGPRRERRYPKWSLDGLRDRRTERSAPALGALAWGTPLLESALTLLDGERLYYRGLDAVELSRTARFEEVASLLWTGSLEVARDVFPAVASRGSEPRGRALPDRLIAALVEERGERPVSPAAPLPTAVHAAGTAVARLFAAAGARGRGTLAERLARGWRAPDVRVLESALILCADHELNASAFTARVVAAAGAPLPSALLAALLALEGQRHGGATRLAFSLLDDVEAIGVRRARDRWIKERGWLPGLDHPAYPSGDPRAAELLRRLDLPRTDPAARTIADAESRGSTPNLDLALAALARNGRLPRDSAFGLFALGRSVGWVGHALEAANGPLIRPRARYVGPPPTT